MPIIAPVSRFTNRIINRSLSLDCYHDGGATYDNALEAALDAGLPIDVFPDRVYTFDSAHTLPANAVIRGRGGQATFKTVGSGQRLFTISSSGVRLSDLVIDGDNGTLTKAFEYAISLSGADNCLLSRVTLQDTRRGFDLSSGSYLNTLEDCETIDCDSHGVVLDGSTVTKNTITRHYVDGCAGFGVLLTAGANKNEVSFCRTYDTLLELVGVTYDCWGNRIANNHAEGSGDNGISVTGYQNVVVGNTCRNNGNNGIFIYGKGNAVTGNVCVNNGQNGGTTYCGIGVGGAFGGQGTDNIVSGNTCIDDQAVPTQSYGVRLFANQYFLWAAATSWSPSNRYCYYGLNVYRASSLTVTTSTGATPPTHTSGTVSDGAIDWTFLFSVAASFNANHNSIGPNIATGNAIADFSDGSSLGNAQASLTALKLKVDGADRPIHVRTYNATPQSALTGNLGDIVLRNGFSANIAMYAKEGSDGATSSWVPFQVRRFGVTGARPSHFSGLEGMTYFDTTLNKVVVSSGAGSSWLDGLGRIDPVTGISAAGSTQPDATQLSYAHSIVSTVGAGEGVLLPSLQSGMEMWVFNRGANTLNVYPKSGGQINDLGTDVAITIASGSSAMFVGTSTTQCFAG